MPEAQEILLANRAAMELSGDLTVEEMRHGGFSAHTHEQLTAYTPLILSREQVVEIWTVKRGGNIVPLSCRLSSLRIDGQPDAILVEGIVSGERQAPVRPQEEPGPSQNNNESRFYETLFRTNSAPMLLIDPSSEGRIVDANEAATRFYGYSREEFARKHTWEINAIGREILPVMMEIAKLPGGHKPLSFVHRLADGSLRDVQTYAGPIEHEGKRLMLCVIHDITEQKRLKTELERAALRDPLTGLWNRRHLLLLLEQARVQKRLYDIDYSLILLDADLFKVINDQYGHFVGDEVLVMLAKTLEAHVRETDSICRWGGEEFVILLPQTKLESAVNLAERLRETVEQIQAPHLPKVTVSIGVAQYHDVETTESLIMRVDSALYRAKALGRNRVVSA